MPRARRDKNAASYEAVVAKLLQSPEPSVRYKIRVHVLGESPRSPEVKRLAEEVRTSPRVKALLADVRPDGRIRQHPYKKWYGAHWVLATLAELDYPPGDDALVPLRDQVCDWLFSKEHATRVQEVAGRWRRCASQEAYALFAMLRLGLADERADELARRLVKWQWPDGGWNCDRRREAKTSSFHESLIPLRALTLYHATTGDKKAKAAARKAAEFFLQRKLYRRLRDDSIIKDDFLLLHYPSYWHYDVLGGLRAMAEAGLIRDRRCHDALGLLTGKLLAKGGWPAEKCYYHHVPPHKVINIPSGVSRVCWGPTGTTRVNHWVTAEALYILRAAGRVPF